MIGIGKEMQRTPQIAQTWLPYQGLQISANEDV